MCLVNKIRFYDLIGITPGKKVLSDLELDNFKKNGSKENILMIKSEYIDPKSTRSYSLEDMDSIYTKIFYEYKLEKLLKDKICLIKKRSDVEYYTDSDAENYKQMSVAALIHNNKSICLLSIKRCSQFRYGVLTLMQGHVSVEYERDKDKTIYEILLFNLYKEMNEEINGINISFEEMKTIVKTDKTYIINSNTPNISNRHAAFLFRIKLSAPLKNLISNEKYKHDVKTISLRNLYHYIDNFDTWVLHSFHYYKDAISTLLENLI